MSGKAAFESRISDAHYGAKSEYERSSKRMMRTLVPAAAPMRILDVGCGTGLNASFLSKSGHTVTGVDISGVAVEQFRKNGFEGFVCDIETQSLPAPDGSYDLIYASEVIEHCADTSSFLRELFRLLKPGGTLLISTPNSAFWPFRIFGAFGRTPTEYQHPGHVRFFSKRSFTKSIASAGFTVEFVAGRHMYALLGSAFDRIEPLLRATGFEKENRFATGGTFWQFSKFSKHASSFWTDTLFIRATKPNLSA